MEQFMRYLITVCLFYLAGCSDPPPTMLINDYYYFETSGYNAYIIKNNMVEVDSNVSKVEVYQGFIIGVRTEPKVLNNVEELSPESFGYFKIDTITGQVELGLEEADILLFKSSLADHDQGV